MKPNYQTLFKLDEAGAKKLAEAFSKASFQSAVKELKESTTDNGTFRMVISTDQVDRHGEVVNQDGWLTDNYMKNAVVLWGHDSYSIPVGITDKLSMVIENGVKSLVAEGRFASHEFAQVLRQMYDDGMLNASSVGFIPLEYDANVITKAELLEWSFVSIPANPFALAARGYDLNMLVAKGVIKEGDEVKEGEEVITDTTVVEEEVEEGKDEEEVVETPVVADEEVANVEDTEEGVELTFADGTTKTFKRASTYKAGRVLSKVNRGKIEAAYAALEEVLAADTTSEEEGKGIDAQPEDSEEAKAKNILTIRRALQGVFGDLQQILVDAKKIAKEEGIKTR